MEKASDLSFESHSEPVETEWDSLAEKEQMPRIQIIDMVKSREGALSSEFKNGVYLFHGTGVRKMKEIIGSGAIMNAGAIYDAKLEEKRKELIAQNKTEAEIEDALKLVTVEQNSGNEGISWSANGIDALPGDSGHIVGFVAAPELVLSETEELVVPSRPASYELLQVSNKITDPERFFESKKQYEVWGYRDVSLGERATVDNGLTFLYINAKYRRENPDADTSESMFAFGEKSLLNEFAQRGGKTAEELRPHYEMTDDGRVKIDAQLHQQRFNEEYLPPAAVFMQSMIDRGMFEGTSCDGLDVNELIARSYQDEKLVGYMLYYAREEAKKYKEEYEAELQKAEAVKAPVEQMYLVCGKADLDMWMEEMQKAGHWPKGVLLYDDERVKEPNFAQEIKGDHEELAKEIGRVVGADQDFWLDKMDMDVEKMGRAGTFGQVLPEKDLKHDNVVVCRDGKLEVLQAMQNELDASS